MLASVIHRQELFLLGSEMLVKLFPFLGRDGNAELGDELIDFFGFEVRAGDVISFVHDSIWLAVDEFGEADSCMSNPVAGG